MGSRVFRRKGRRKRVREGERETERGNNKE